MEQLTKLAQIDNNGWVLVDFPTNFEQAKLLEEAFSGFIPE